MDQQLDATYLRHGLVERAAAIGIGAVGIGTSVLLAAWGISFLWRYTPPEIAVRIANPEVHVTQAAPLIVTQDKPFIVAQSEPFKIDPATVTIKVEQTPALPGGGVGGDPKTANGDVIKREVTVFWNLKHGPGHVVTGWSYPDGSGRVPVSQFCYYTTPNGDYSKRIDIATNGDRSPYINASLVPDLEGALVKCHWWKA
jgi:hypothetical protein